MQLNEPIFLELSWQDIHTPFFSNYHEMCSANAHLCKTQQHSCVESRKGFASPFNSFLKNTHGTARCLLCPDALPEISDNVILLRFIHYKFFLHSIDECPIKRQIDLYTLPTIVIKHLLMPSIGYLSSSTLSKGMFGQIGGFLIIMLL